MEKKVEGNIIKGSGYSGGCILEGRTVLGMESVMLNHGAQRKYNVCHRDRRDGERKTADLGGGKQTLIKIGIGIFYV